MHNKAVFLDRDGTLIEDKGYVYRIEDFMPVSNVLKALSIMADLGFMLIIITNQSGVARGYFSESHLNQFFKYFNDYFNSNGIYFAGIYYCPHHPDGTVSGYIKECECRKPKTGLFERAISELAVEPEISYTIGDSARDIIAGNLMKTTTILISENIDSYIDSAKGLDIPDYKVSGIMEAARIIKENSLH